ncbi:MAG: hypothetical protein ACU833_10355 [Gammaproteobacteria bacterium]
MAVIAAAIPFLSGAKKPFKVTEEIQRDFSDRNEIQKQGVNIQMELLSLNGGDKGSANLHEGENSSIRFIIKDETTQEPIKGLHPMAWLDRFNQTEGDLSCKSRIGSFLQGNLAFQPEINLNSYYILTLNDKASISVLDPLNGYGNSKMITRILLNSPGEDWVLSADGKRLYVATPLSRQVAVIDTSSWKVIHNLEFLSSPTRLALQPDQHYLWIGLTPEQDRPGFSGAVAVDTETLEIAEMIATGAGKHVFNFSDDSQFVYIGTVLDKTISVIAIADLAKAKEIAMSASPVALGYSALAKAVYAAGANGDISVIDNESNRIIKVIQLGSPIDSMKFSPDGRWGFAVSRLNNRLFVYDVSDNRLIHDVEIGHAPDQISFSDTFAYIRSRDSELIDMVRLDSLNQGEQLAINSFTGGQRAPGDSQRLIDSDALVQTPERNAMLVANPVDKTVYYYMEGMAAPMGSFKNFGLDPMAVLVVDRSLQERSPGVYETTVKLPPSGEYVVPIVISNPKMHHCFSAVIETRPGFKKATLNLKEAIEYSVDKKSPSVGETVTVKIKIAKAFENSDSISDLQALTFLIPGTWQQRYPVHALGDGFYEFQFIPPSAGFYRIHVQSPSLTVEYETGPILTLQAVEADQSAKIKSKGDA